jgi:hypothetical protein
MCDVWCVMCDVWCVVCDVWCVVCGVYSVICDAAAVAAAKEQGSFIQSGRREPKREYTYQLHPNCISPEPSQLSGKLSPASHSPHIPAHLLAGGSPVASPLGLGFGSGGGNHSMSPQSLGISGTSEADAHKLRLTVAEMRRDAAVLEQRVRAAEVRARQAASASPAPSSLMSLHPKPPFHLLTFSHGISFCPRAPAVCQTGCRGQVSREE